MDGVDTARPLAATKLEPRIDANRRESGEIFGLWKVTFFAPKGQRSIAQGNALGNMEPNSFGPVGAS